MMRLRFRAMVASATLAWMLAPDLTQAQVIRQVGKKDLTLTIDIDLRAIHRRDKNLKTKITEEFTFDSAAFVFPAVRLTSSSVAEMSGVLKLNNRASDRQLTLLPEQYPCGATLARWEAKDWSGTEASLAIKIRAQCYSTEMDEAAAMKLTWPANWTKTLQSCFEPQMYIDVGPDAAYDMTPVKDLVKRWMRGKDPKSQPPMLVAKVLAGELSKYVQLSGSGIANGRMGQVEGLQLQGAAETARKGRGSPFDAVALMAAVYREVGLPARIVVGWDSGKSKENDDGGFLNTGKGKGKEKLHAWVEIGLMNNSEEIWIPVDLLKLKKSGSQLPPYDKPWPYFGTHPELDSIIPFAFHYFPPTTVRSYGSPGFWGWLVMPKPPEQAEQSIRFDASSTAKTAEDQKKEREENEKKNRGRR
jgi:Transglutaminase-like superfamily